MPHIVDDDAAGALEAVGEVVDEERIGLEPERRAAVELEHADAHAEARLPLQQRPARAAARSNTAGPASSTMCRSVSTKSWIMVGAASATAKLRASLPDASIWWNWTTGSFTL